MMRMRRLPYSSGVQQRPACPTSDKINANFYINAYTLSISDIEANYMETTQSLYGAPTEKPDYFKEPNLLDAILAAFFENGIDITDSDTVYAGWDATPVRGNPGGYINYVAPQLSTYTMTPPRRRWTALNTTSYSGEWLEHCLRHSASNIKALNAYGTSTALEDGMVIVFDFSPYRIYDVL